MTSQIQNQLEGRTANPVLSALFKPSVIFALVVIGILSFAALTLLSGYADDLRKNNSPSATPLSSSAIGYAGFAELLRHMDYEVSLPNNLPANTRRRGPKALRIYSLAYPNQAKALKDLPDNEAKLIILPKWKVKRYPKNPAWVRHNSAHPTLLPEDLTGPLNKAKIKVTLKKAPKSDNLLKHKAKFHTGINAASETISDVNIAYLQSFDINKADSQHDIILDIGDMPVLIRLDGTQTYIMSDPDIVNTHGLATRTRAKLAVQVIEQLIHVSQSQKNAAAFDLSIHGLGGQKNLIKLLTQPPFLAATLCLLAAGLLISWQAFTRFGDPETPRPDYAQGPASLAKSAAEFMSVSNRISHMAPDYAALTRRQLIRELGLSGQSQDYIERWIKARENQRKITPSFDALQKAAQMAAQTAVKTSPTSSQNLTEHARALARWKEEMSA